MALFEFPHAHDIWIDYLNAFVARYGGRKLERARDLFEQVIEKVPAGVANTFFLMYAALEEEYGLVRHSTSIYERATKAVDDEHRFEMYQISVKKVRAEQNQNAPRSLQARTLKRHGAIPGHTLSLR